MCQRAWSTLYQTFSFVQRADLQSIQQLRTFHCGTTIRQWSHSFVCEWLQIRKTYNKFLRFHPHQAIQDKPSLLEITTLCLVYRFGERTRRCSLRFHPNKAVGQTPSLLKTILLRGVYRFGERTRSALCASTPTRPSRTASLPPAWARGVQP